jgi:hypothetical protein
MGCALFSSSAIRRWMKSVARARAPPASIVEATVPAIPPGAGAATGAGVTDGGAGSFLFTF